ncbi:angiotensin-converting enzyme [Nephila pilipes]|uniref:Angiotensin-converting enzyme n=1 Tax=Nephila pilipes TaxID=299642 RepID=A0A8X6UHQ1_NEPPI|nr:angiotensin-converting enzyme [Nephila pilipes]
MANMKISLLVTLAFFCVYSLLLDAKEYDEIKQTKGEKSQTMKDAIKFMEKANKQAFKYAQKIAHASWNWSVNVTDANLKEQGKIQALADINFEETFLKSTHFPWKSFKKKNETLYRWFKLVSKGQSDVKREKTPPETTDEEDCFSKMTEIYSKVKFCKYQRPNDECNLPYDPDVINLMGTSNNPKERKYYWLELRKKTGRKIKKLFIQSVKQMNKIAKIYGFNNKAELELNEYEDANFEKYMAKQIEKLRPFFEEMHAYVRRKLIENYEEENIREDGPIPAHLLGDMYAQTWDSINPIVIPYPKSLGVPNVTEAMLKKKMKPIDMFIMAENFFTSIGLKRMTPYFWKYSLLERPTDGRNVDCHASANDFSDGKDYRGISPNIKEVSYSSISAKFLFMQFGTKPDIVFADTAAATTENIKEIIINYCYSIAWPPRSPDLTRYDFWLPGSLKSSVYQGVA